MTSAAAAHRKALKALRDERDDAVQLAAYRSTELANERQSHAKTRANQQGFREGVAWAIRQMVKEINTWHGSSS